MAGVVLFATCVIVVVVVVTVVVVVGISMVWW